MVRIGVVGGSSLVSFDPKNEFDAIGLKIASSKEKVVKTKYGDVKLKFLELKGKGGEHTLIFMQRHGHSKGGITPPHKINHRANVMALADQKVDAIVATTSVGTILPIFPPGRVGVSNQYIDFTGQVITFHDDDAKFTSVTQPFDAKLNAALLKTLRREQKLKESVQLEFTYFLSQGPFYETPAEVTAAERLGAHVCGMTAVREAKLCREIDLPYSALTIASNWAAGRQPGDPNFQLSHSEVAEMSAKVTGTIVACLVDLLKNGLPGAAEPSNGASSARPSKKQKR
jgi:5'-methylthioinosine phosphorylase